MISGIQGHGPRTRTPGHAGGDEATSTYGLLPAFLDGLLDAAPPASLFVDGTEAAYLFTDRDAFEGSRASTLAAAPCLLSTENVERYERQVKVGFGIYLDAYVNPAGSDYYIGPGSGTRLGRLRENIGAALEFADEYVWVYGEGYRWWPTPNESVSAKTWEDALPGVSGAFRAARAAADR